MVDNNNTKSALEHNIKTKGEYSYYYAHGKKFEKDQNSAVTGKTFEGEGLIYGGDPVLVDKKKEVVVLPIKTPNIFTKYIFYDDESFTKIKIDLPEIIKDLVTSDCLAATFDERSFELKVLVPNFEPYIMVIKRLYMTIIPDMSYTKLIKGKIIVGLKKKKEDEVWEKLSASAKTEDD